MADPLLFSKSSTLVIIGCLVFGLTVCGAASYQSGDQLSYRINVPGDGFYDLALRVACGGTGATVRIEIDAAVVATSVSIPNTGDLETWTTVESTNLSLTSGVHDLGIIFTSNADSGNAGAVKWVRLHAAKRPGTLTVSPLSESSVKLTWLDRCEGEIGFLIKRKVGASGSFETITTVAGDTTTYTDTGLSSGQLYIYRVCAEYTAQSVSGPTNDGRVVLPHLLTPGSGWTGETAQPPAEGTSGQSGFDARVISRWDVVPFRSFDGDFMIGAPAFHMNGVDRVEFSVNNGPWKSASEMVTNPRTGVKEYCALLRASSFSDEAIEVRALAYPTVGEPRLLDSLFLYANPSGASSNSTYYVDVTIGSDTNSGSQAEPFASLEYALGVADPGSTIILERAGEYNINRSSLSFNSNSRWITVQSADSLATDDVILMTDDGGSQQCRPNVRLIHWKNVSFDWKQIGLYFPVGDTHSWYDNCIWFNSGGRSDRDDGHPAGGHRFYATDSVCKDRFNGYGGAYLVRDCQLERISGDVLNEVDLVINCTSDYCYNTTGWSDWHSDIFQYYGDHDNVLVYGFTSSNALSGIQNIFINQPLAEGNSMRDVAFVNLTLDYTIDDAGTSQLQGPLDHILFINVSNEQSWLMRTDFTDLNALTANNVIMDSCRFDSYSYTNYVDSDSPIDGITFTDCELLP